MYVCVHLRCAILFVSRPSFAHLRFSFCHFLCISRDSRADPFHVFLCAMADEEELEEEEDEALGPYVRRPPQRTAGQQKIKAWPVHTPLCLSECLPENEDVNVHLFAVESSGEKEHLSLLDF